MPAATLTLKDWAEGHAEATWSRVMERENARASKEVIWYHRGRHAAYQHVIALANKYPEIADALIRESTDAEIALPN